MPDVVAKRSVRCSPSRVWECVGDMDRWAPMLRGYLGHEKSSETESVWTLTGELGPFTKEIRLNVRITDWREQERVAFEMQGVGEPVSASGALEMSGEAPERGAWLRFWDWLLRRDVSEGPSHVTFTFAIDAGGPMGPMINPMLGPYAEAVARDLLASVAAHLEGASDD